jgi:hypothetical protein
VTNEEAVAHLRHVASICSMPTKLWEIADLLAAALPPAGHIMDEFGVVREVIEWSVNPINKRGYLTFAIDPAEAAQRAA